MTCCEVIVEIAHENVGHVFTYRVPDGLSLLPGTRVLAPFGSRTVEGYVLRLKDGPGDVPPEKLRTILRALDSYPAILPALMDLAAWLCEKAHCLPVEALRLMLPAQMRGERVRVKTAQWAHLTAQGEALEQALAAARRAPRRRKSCAAWRRATSRPRRCARSAQARCRRSAGRAWSRSMARETLRRPAASGFQAAPEAPLTDDQCRVLEEILPAMARGEGRFLLSGVTGSGKTEVYIRAVRAALADGKGAIVLVPEIALTPQMVGWFRSRFGQDAAVLHSRLSAGERYDEWRRIRRGDARVVVGARSAVFAPVERLGIIIVDEEHEQTYLNDHHPRYDAREVAQRRCEQEHATLLLASATPSLKSFSRTMPHLRSSLGPLTLLEMPAARAGQAHAARGDCGHAAGAGARKPHGVQPRAGPGAPGMLGARRTGDAVHQPARVLHLRQLPRLRPGRQMPALRHQPDLPPRGGYAALPLLRP